MTRDEAIQKALKLLKLAGSCYPEEAALAAQRAQEILDRYEISSAMLQEAGEAPTEPEEEIVNFQGHAAPVDIMGQNLSWWAVYLAGHLAKVNACCIFLGYVFGDKRRRTIEIIGRPSDVEKVRYLYQYLCREVDRLADRDGRGCGKTWRNQFRMGVVATIGGKLAQAQQQVQSEMRGECQGNAQALVRLDRAIARLSDKQATTEQWVKAHMKFKNARGSAARTDYGAYQRGRKAGEEVAVNANTRGALGSGAKRIGSAGTV